MKTYVLASVLLLVSSFEAQAGLKEGNQYMAKGQYERALVELKPLADRGDAGAQFFVGAMYLDGLGVTPDVKAGMKFLEASAAQSDSGAQFRLGRIYYDGKHQPQDLDKTKTFVRKAAEQGLGEAITFLGVLYYKGAGVPQSAATALALLRDASAKLTIAVAKGEALPAALSDTQQALNALEGRLSAEQKMEATKTLNMWHLSHRLPGDK